MPKSGDAVLVHGQLSIYDARSQYQIIGDYVVMPAGVGRVTIGSLKGSRNSLKRKDYSIRLTKSRYRNFHRRLVLSPLQQGQPFVIFIRMLQERYPAVEVLLFPTLVQGGMARAEEIAHAIGCLNRQSGIDLLIVGRGGGSIEDLWAFNEEVVVRALFASHIPTVSAVGHETDFTIADLVADHRAPTPSAAVENIVPDQEGTSAATYRC